ncbi:MAG: urease accessory protein UreF [Deltaproteobacteria bacterium]|nr:urease accessory protein UreF [Deltaproteobacteria bacterium]
MTDTLTLIRLLQLASPALPVGAYTYSQGLEWAVESGVVCNEQSAHDWLFGLLQHAVGLLEAPLFACLYRAWMDGNDDGVWQLNAEFLASRETSELRAETVQMGYSLRRLAGELADCDLEPFFSRMEETAFPTVWTAMAAVWKIPITEALCAYLFNWCENQIMAAVKLVPLGQSAGQRLLQSLGERIPEVADRALKLPEESWSNFAPGLAIAGSRHESQYSRLFRS